jgi:serine O-acetyltransferase
MNKSLVTYLESINNSYCSEVPSVVDTHSFVDDLINLLFPIRINRSYRAQEIEIRLDRLQLRLKELLIPLQKEIKQDPAIISAVFFDKLEGVYRTLLKDAEECMKGDPAASCIEEIILSYPGFYCLTVHRLAHVLYLEEVPVVTRIMSEYAHSLTGIDIHPGASIGENFFIDHGTGIVIGETAVVGNNVKIYQGVTLGAIYVERSLKDKKRHPTIQDNVIIYAGATILGGKTTVGHDTIIGGNVWLTESVLPHSVVYRNHKAIIKDSKNFEEPLNYII